MRFRSGSQRVNGGIIHVAVMNRKTEEQESQSMHEMLKRCHFNFEWQTQWVIQIVDRGGEGGCNGGGCNGGEGKEKKR